MPLTADDFCRTCGNMLVSAYFTNIGYRDMCPLCDVKELEDERAALRGMKNETKTN